MTDDSQPLNREQRRKQKFSRKAAARQDNLLTQRQNSTGFLTDTPDAATGEGADANAGDAHGADSSTTENDKATTGPGAGGATESAERAPHHEGLHGGPTRNS